jgi:hypothetical protein
VPTNRRRHAGCGVAGHSRRSWVFAHTGAPVSGPSDAGEGKPVRHKKGSRHRHEPNIGSNEPHPASRTESLGLRLAALEGLRAFGGSVPPFGAAMLLVVAVSRRRARRERRRRATSFGPQRGAQSAADETTRPESGARFPRPRAACARCTSPGRRGSAGRGVRRPGAPPPIAPTSRALEPV